MRNIIGIAVMLVVLGVVIYFAYSLVWFIAVGRRGEARKTSLVTIFAYLAVLASATLWFWGLKLFSSFPTWYSHEQLLLWVSVSLCIAALSMARFCARRTSIPISTAACVVALNWIGSVIRQ